MKENSESKGFYAVVWKALDYYVDIRIDEFATLSDVAEFVKWKIKSYPDGGDGTGFKILDIYSINHRVSNEAIETLTQEEEI